VDGKHLLLINQGSTETLVTQLRSRPETLGFNVVGTFKKKALTPTAYWLSAQGVFHLAISIRSDAYKHSVTLPSDKAHRRLPFHCRFKNRCIDLSLGLSDYDPSLRR